MKKYDIPKHKLLEALSKHPSNHSKGAMYLGVMRKTYVKYLKLHGLYRSLFKYTKETLTKDAIETALSTFETYAECAASLGVCVETFTRYAKTYDLYTKKKVSAHPIEDIINCKVRIVNYKTLKNILIKHYKRKLKCSKCGLKDTWQGEPICIQLDHIDGNRDNNSPKNLRFLCPNCHSQTSTYGGKNSGRYSKAE